MYARYALATLCLFASARMASIFAAPIVDSTSVATAQHGTSSTRNGTITSNAHPITQSIKWSIWPTDAGHEPLHTLIHQELTRRNFTHAPPPTPQSPDQAGTTTPNGHATALDADALHAALLALPGTQGTTATTSGGRGPRRGPSTTGRRPRGRHGPRKTKSGGAKVSRTVDARAYKPDDE